MHAGCVEPIFEAVLTDDLSGIAAIVASTPAATAQRMAEDIFVTELTHMLYRDDTPLPLAAAGLRYAAARATGSTARCCATPWPPGQLSWRSRVAMSEQIHSSAMRPPAMR